MTDTCWACRQPITTMVVQIPVLVPGPLFGGALLLCQWCAAARTPEQTRAWAAELRGEERE